MGLTSTLTTALTGLTGAETQIDVIGNNLANSQTTGFKQSRALFATQFLQTISIGSSPTEESGGTNPRQTGLGVTVSEIALDYSQGTVEISTSPSDMAIQGDGFFIVESAQNEQLYTRNGIFKLNANNELVTTTGQRLLGYGVDEFYTIQRTELQSLTIPLGAAAVAQPTTNVTLEGTLTPTGDIADTGQVIESLTLGDESIPQPDPGNMTASAAPIPNPDQAPPTTAASTNVGGGTLAAGTQYEYRFTFVDAVGTESAPSLEASVVQAQVAAGNNAITLSNLPVSPGGPAFEYPFVNVYRRQVGAASDTPQGQWRLVGEDVNYSAPFTDNGSIDITAAPELDTTSLSGSYSYMITFAQTGGQETRPVAVPGGSVTVVNGRVHLRNLPTPPVPGADDNFPQYNEVRLYRNLRNNPETFFLVDTLAPGDSFTDSRSDTEISDLTIMGNKALDADGPRIELNTRLTDVIRRNGNDYRNVFAIGTLTFEGRKGGRTLADQEFEITDDSTVGDLLQFMEDSLGIQFAGTNDINPIPGSDNHIPGETGTLSPGATLNDGRIRLVSNNGLENAIDLSLSSMSIATPDGLSVSPELTFSVLQEAQGQSAVADFVVYDTLGVPLNVRVTTVLESRDDSTTVYRWFADSSNNDPAVGTAISVGTGLIRFDGEGRFISTDNDIVAIQRQNIPSLSPLEFEMDFTRVTGLAAESSTLAASRQDGFPAGKLDTYTIAENGVIRGVFSNGAARDLGQVLLARFSNPHGLEQRGQTLFGQGVNSGLPVVGFPGSEGIGTLVSGAIELSNTDIGKNLTDLVLASTQYRGNARVITTAQQLLDELLNIRR
jgi:flagellar hook protein FlgE